MRDAMKPEDAALRCVAHALNDVGRIRSENQDAWFAELDQGVFLVADGMGGHNAGAAAAQAAAEVIPKLLQEKLARPEELTEQGFESALQESVCEFSRQLRDRGRRDPRLKGTGTTVVLALVRGRRAYVAGLGDSRAYLLKGGRLRMLTQDHSVSAMLQRLGKLTPEQAARHPGRHLLTRHAGMDGKAQADIATLHLKGPCRLLLCTDGLTGMLDDERIEAVLTAEREPQAACRRLVAEANEAGGTDNITAMVVDVERVSAR